MIVQRHTIMELATQVLLTRPGASLAEVAAAANISRTTMYSRYPTREALVAAMAADAMDLMERVYDDLGLDQDEPFDVVVSRLVEAMLPLGARVEFLLRERSLDDDTEVAERYRVLNRPLEAYIERAQARGTLSSLQPAWWAVAAMLGTVYTAWEAIADGRLALRDAPNLVVQTVLDGLRGAS